MNFTLCADADLDQLCDSVESQLGTDPQSGDGDGDRFEDELEVRLGSNPKSAESIPAFDIYVLKGSDSQQLARQAGFDGPLTELAAMDTRTSAIRLRIEQLRDELQRLAVHALLVRTAAAGARELLLVDAQEVLVSPVPAFAAPWWARF